MAMQLRPRAGSRRLTRPRTHKRVGMTRRGYIRFAPLATNLARLRNMSPKCHVWTAPG
jgi:hypothetical protein